MKKSVLFLAMILAVISGIAQSISEIQGFTALSPYDGDVVSTSGIVTGVHGDGYFIQDGSAEWSGIYVYDPGHTAEEGMSVELTAEVEEFFEWTELKSVSSFTVVSEGNDLPEPIEISTDELNDEAYESVLVRISSAECTNPDLGFGEYEFNDGSGACMGDDLLFAPNLQQGLTYNVSGPVTYSFENYKILPRRAEDVEVDAPLYITIAPEESDLQTTSLTINWETNAPSDSRVSYGITEGVFDQEITDTELVTQHSISLDGLEPGTPYFLNIESHTAENSTIPVQRTVSTVSQSSGEIKVYFNHIVDNSVASEEEAVWTLSIADTIAEYILKAEETLDIALYDLLNSDPVIFNAINTVHDAGVQVRYLTDDEPENIVLETLNPGIPVLRGNEGNGLMHNKFILIDKDDVDNAWVISGSTNHTGANLGWDYNNMICVQDQSLARAYTIEFEEMWGGSELEPSPENSRFGEDKVDNTPHKFLIDGIETELYFSPSDGTTDEIRSVLENAESEIGFAILVFTENSLGTAIADAHDAGLDVKGMIDYVEFNGSEYNFLLDNGVAVQDYQNEDGTQWPDGPTLHHKYAIVDYAEGSENPVLITGSHNWTASAESIHDENTLIFYDHRLANLYHQELEARIAGMMSTGIEETIGSKVSIYPNPNHGQFTIDSNVQQPFALFDLQGREVERGILQSGKNQLILDQVEAGMYQVRIGRSITESVIIK